MKRTFAAVVLYLFAASASAAGLADITNKDAVSGLRQALTDGAAAAVGKLGVENGFFGNTRVKIPLPESLQKKVRQQSNCEARRVLSSMEFSYSVTRYKVRLLCFVCETADAVSESTEEQAWFTLADIASLPLSATGRRIAKWLDGQVLP